MSCGSSGSVSGTKSDFDCGLLGVCDRASGECKCTRVGLDKKEDLAAQTGVMQLSEMRTKKLLHSTYPGLEWQSVSSDLTTKLNICFLPKMAL
jgi:hypothetical protein